MPSFVFFIYSPLLFIFYFITFNYSFNYLFTDSYHLPYILDNLYNELFTGFYFYAIRLLSIYVSLLKNEKGKAPSYKQFL